MKNSFSSVGQVPAVKEFQAIVLHDRDGRIHHMHYVVMFEGARPIDYETMKQEAYEQAKMQGVDVSKLEILHVPQLQNPHAMHRVDMKSKTLVELPPPKPIFSHQKPGKPAPGC